MDGQLLGAFGWGPASEVGSAVEQAVERLAELNRGSKRHPLRAGSRRWFASVEDAAQELARKAPADLATDILAAHQHGNRWWSTEQGLVRTEEVEFDEASGTWSYWDWYHPDPALRARLEERAARVLDWLESLAPQAGVERA